MVKNYLREFMKKNKIHLMLVIQKVTQRAKDLFNQYKEEIDTYDDFEKAVAFFIMNKCSFSGLTENSTFSQTASNSNFSLVGARKLADFS